MGLLSFLGLGQSAIKNALKNGAIIIDVRTPHEFDQGHVRDAIHIPLDRISVNAERIKQMNCPIIFCCASGSRSGKAVEIMRSKGMKEVYNGGSWEGLIKLLKSI
jgi:rhodanese-related sulfurtransferase